MASRDIEFKVGVIVLIGLILLFASLYWLQGYKLERNAQKVTVRFSDVGTLAVGDRVTVSGVHRGKVSGLELTESGVLVDLLLYKDVVLKSDARIVIKNLGLMGERFIAISPGSDSTRFDASQVVQGYYDAGLPEVMGLMGEMIVELRSLVGSIKNTVAADSSLTKFNRTVNNLEKVSAMLSNVMEDNSAKIGNTVDNFNSASKRLNKMLADNQPKLDTTFGRLERATSGLDDFVARLDTLSLELNEFAASVNNPDGTMNLLMNDRRLYDDLRRTADNIDDLILDIRQNPGRYINLKVELF